MYTGTMIDDLIKTVEKSERQASAQMLLPALMPRMEAFPKFSVCAYEWPRMEQAIVGVA